MRTAEKRGAMLRPLHDFDVPGDTQWHRATTGPQRHLWWLIALLVLLGMFLIGVGVTSGLI